MSSLSLATVLSQTIRPVDKVVYYMLGDLVALSECKEALLETIRQEMKVEYLSFLVCHLKSMKQTSTAIKQNLEYSHYCLP